MAEATLAASPLMTPDFDRAHLDHITMQDQSLAVEVLNLFMSQLPATLAQLAAVGTGADWRFAAHHLKGAAAAVGARKLSAMAAGLEEAAFPDSPEARDKELQPIAAAAVAFRQAARQAFPALN
jgi:HPt (histidine-containing phosphotransfer) domain-containing protein